MFTGSLGIPNVSTHVGSVVHAFETMAQQNSPQQSFELVSDFGEGQHQRSKSADEGKLWTNDFHHQRNTVENNLVHGAEQHHQLVSVPPAPPPPILNILNSGRMPSPTRFDELKIETAKNLPFDYRSSNTLPHNRLSKNNNSKMIASESVQQQPPPPLPNESALHTRTDARAEGRSDGGKSQRQNAHAGSRSDTVAIPGTSHTIQNNGILIPMIKAKEMRSNQYHGPPHMLNDFRRNVSGANSNFAATRETLSTKPRINYSDVLGSEANRKMAQRNDSNNNLKQSMPTKRLPEVYVIPFGDKNYLLSNGNKSSGAKEEPEQSSFEDNWRAIQDDLAFLRGTTVSQSFIKNIKKPATATNFHRSSTEISKAPAGAIDRQSKLSAATQSYYTPRKYVLSDDDFEDELRSRYTEHRGGQKKTATAKPFKLTKNPGFGYVRHK